MFRSTGIFSLLLCRFKAPDNPSLLALIVGVTCLERLCRLVAQLYMGHPRVQGQTTLRWCGAGYTCELVQHCGKDVIRVARVWAHRENTACSSSDDD